MSPETAQQDPVYLSIATVLYRCEEGPLLRFRDCLVESVQQLRRERPVARVYLAVVDNAASEDGDRFSRLFTRLPGIDAVRFIQPDENLGYGKAHNLCMHQGGDFHLILNPDVYLDRDALVAGIDFLTAHPTTGMVTPYGVNDHGDPLFLSKRYPTVLDFLLRGFAPRCIRQRLFANRLARYEMHREYLSGNPSDQVEIASGCCMLLRTDLLHRLHGFCEDYFLYFEDFDLSVRLRQHALISLVPQMKIVHDGGHAARKGWWHIRQFSRSGHRFFSTHGWDWL
jgi:hypothetical protein